MSQVAARRFGALVLLVSAWSATTGQASGQDAPADTKQRVHAGCGETGCDSSAAVTTRLRPAARKGASDWTCTYTPLALPPNFIVYDDQSGTPVATDGTGHWLVKDCVGPGGAHTIKSIYVGNRPPTEVRDEALAHLDLPAPEIRMSPRPELDQIVHIRTFLWTDESLWRPQVSTVSVPGVAVTVRAVPEALDWNMGTGASEVVHCTGPGRPWNPALPEDRQDTACSFVYRRPSIQQPSLRYPVTATLHWRVSWSVTGAPGGGDLGTVSRSSTTSVRVIEVQTVNY